MTNAINISNYELFALDYLDGTLSADMREQFEAFLLLHPSIAEELSGMADPELVVQPIPSEEHPGPDLKWRVTAVAGIDEDNYEWWFSESAAQALSSAQEAGLARFLEKNPFLQHDYKLYMAAVLRPRAEVVYGNRGALYQSIPLWASISQYSYRVAAVLVLAAGIYTLWPTETLYDPRREEWTFGTLESFIPGAVSMDRGRTNQPGETSLTVAADVAPSMLAGDQTRVLSPGEEKQQVAMIAVVDDPRVETHDPMQSPESLQLRQDGELPSGEVAARAQAPELTGQRPTGKTPIYTPIEYLSHRLLGVTVLNAHTARSAIVSRLGKWSEKNTLLAVEPDATGEGVSDWRLNAGIFELRRVNGAR